MIAADPLFTTSQGNDENQSRTAGGEKSHRDLPSSTSILQEINNSAHRRRQRTRPALENIFQDEPIDSENLLDSKTDNSPCSPTQDILNSSFAMAKSKEGDKAGGPTNRPIATQVKARKKSRMSQSSTSYETNQYIEHLESELASLNAKLDSLTSPLTTASQAAKIRSLNRQISSFRQELADWDTKFEDRVSDEIFQRTRSESDLKTQIKTLEAARETQDVTICDLQHELEVARTKLVETESLELTLGRRVDVLTELLAQSPTRMTFASASAPLLPEASNPVSPTRPRLPMSASSPFIGKQSGELTGDLLSHYHGPSTLSSNVLECSEHAEQDDFITDFQTCGNHNQSGSISTRSNSDNATSHQSTSSSSRPTSMISNSSFGTSWGLPLVPEEAKSNGRLRKMRRFGPGSTCLKPLILPTTSSLPQSLPASAPVRPSFQTPETSNSSLDPTFAFLSDIPGSPPSSTPTRSHLLSPHRRRASWNQSQTLHALEGRPYWVSDVGVTLGDQTRLEEGARRISADGSPSSFLEAGQGRNLQAELDLVESDGTSGKSITSPPGSQDDRVSFEIRPLRITPPRGDLNTTLMDSQPILARLHGDNRDYGTLSSETRLTPSTRSDGHRQRIRTKSSGNVSVPTTAEGLLGQINGFVASLRQRPINLAKKILMNTWFVGSSRIGGLGWWLLGLVFRPRKRKKAWVADEEAAVDADACDRNQPRKRKGSAISPANVFNTCESDEIRPSHDHYEALAAVLPEFAGPSVGTCSQAYENRDNREVEPELVGITSPSKATDARSQGSRSNATHSMAVRVDTSVHCPKCIEPPSKRSLKLWCKFFLAIVLAVGVAVIEGPGALLSDEPFDEETMDGMNDADNPGSSPRRIIARNGAAKA